MGKKGKSWSTQRPAVARRTRLRVLFERFGGCCAICGKPCAIDTSPTDPRKATVDHRIPRALGGADQQHNWQLACLACNREKGAKLEGGFWGGGEGWRDAVKGRDGGE